MKNDMDDFELAKLSLAKKVKDLCRDFLRDTGKEVVYLKVLPTKNTTLAFDAQGKTCVGCKHDITVNAWTEEEFASFLSGGFIVDDDDDDDD